MSMKKITKAMIFMIVMVASLALNGKLVQAAGDFDYVDSNEDAESIVPHKVTVGDEDDLSKSSNYIIHVPGVTREITIPVIIDHKGILIFKHGDENESTSGYTLKFYSDIACTNEISSYGGKVKFKEAGTYYLKVTLPSYTTITEESFKVIFQCKLLDGRGKSLKNKQWLFTAVLDTGAPVYHKVEISKTGIIKLEAVGDYSFNMTLCNKDKKEISEQVFASTNSSGDFSKVSYGVKKGTYYVKVKTSNDAYRIKSTFTAVSDASGASKKNAKTIKVGETKKGIVLSEDKTSKNDWFKFTLKKSTKIDIDLKGNCSSGKLRFELTSNGIRGTVTDYISSSDYSRNIPLQTWTSKTIPKGTYYIRLYKDSKTTSGNYSVKVKVRK